MAYRKKGSESVVSDKTDACSMTHRYWETDGQKQQICDSTSLYSKLNV